MIRGWRRWGAVGLLGMGLGLLAPALACWGPELESVHFNDARPDFFRMPEPWWPNALPRRAPEASRWSPRRPKDPEGYPLQSPPGMPPDRQASARAARKALSLEQQGRFHQAAAAWEKYAAARRKEWEEAWEEEEAPDYRQGLADRIQALRAWQNAADTPALQLYLQARREIAAGKSQSAEKTLARLEGGRLRLHARYLRAVLQFRRDGVSLTERVTAFRQVLALRSNYLPALYMVGRCYFAHVNELDDSEPPVSGEARADYLRKALQAYEACAAAGPNDPLGRDAEGMAAACRYRLGEYPAALLVYCRRLAQLRPGENEPGTLVSARFCLRRMDEKHHQGFQMLALKEPAAAVAYLDLLLRYGRTGARTQHRLGLFALDLLQKHPAAPVSARFLTRLSLIEDRAGRYERAERLAARALERSRPGADQDEARWQHALALHHLNRTREALREYERLAESAAAPRMRAGAHEAAAVLSEKQRDYASAIRHYFALDYLLDYAYVIDCLASPDDLRTFLKRYPNHPRARLVRYSLGFRQLRAGDYDGASATFTSLGGWLQVAEKAYAANTSKGARRSPPLETARFLAERKRREATAKTSAERARWAYEAGQFLFRQRHLVFYNGALWKGERTWALELHAPYPVNDGTATHNPQNGRAALSPEERAALRRYQEEHAALYQALRIFERVADRYPGTPEAPKALYSAALCYTFLPRLERYWANRQDLDYTARAIRLYHRLQREYPHDPLATDAAKFGGPAANQREVRR